MRIADSSSKKETMMRRNDLRGAHEWIGAEELMSSLMVWRLSGRNISRSFRFVIMRVLEGGVGCWRGGTAAISRLRGVREREDVGDDPGLDWFDMLLVV
jgi:hypothetical protein